MKVQEFHNVKDTNEFAGTVKVKDIQVEGYRYIVFYKDYLTADEAQAIKVLEDTESASVALRQAEMHLDYLLEVERTSTDEGAMVKSGIENTKQNIINEKAKLATALKWKQ